MYAPNKEKDHELYLNKLNEVIAEFYDDDFNHVIAGGDWNFVVNIEKDKKGGVKKVWEKSVFQLDKIREKLDLVDIWRVQHEGKRQYTWAFQQNS